MSSGASGLKAREFNAQRYHYQGIGRYSPPAAYARVREACGEVVYRPGQMREMQRAAVELVRREGVTGVPTEAEVVQKLYPDQATFRREEQRRFEILQAHWDVPLNAVDFERRQVSPR